MASATTVATLDRGLHRRHWFQVEPLFRVIGLQIAVPSPEPHRRLRQREQRREARDTQHRDYRRNRVPVKEHGHLAFGHHANAYEHKHYRER